MTNVKFFPTGDHAMVVEFGSIIAENINQKVHALAGWIEEKQIEGVVELLPTFRSLMIYYDCHVVSFERLKRKVSEFDDTKVSAGAEKKKITKVPCCYGARFGVANRLQVAFLAPGGPEHAQPSCLSPEHLRTVCHPARHLATEGGLP